MGDTLTRSVARTRISFPQPEMEVQTIAQIFSAYLLGNRAFSENSCLLKRSGIWKLDDDYWMEAIGGEIHLICRYPTQTSTLAAMKLLFIVRYGVGDTERMALIGRSSCKDC